MENWLFAINLITGLIFGFALRHFIQVVLGGFQWLWEDILRDRIIKLMEYEVEIEFSVSKGKELIK